MKSKRATAKSTEIAKDYYYTIRGEKEMAMVFSLTAMAGQSTFMAAK
jgi:hypothetical protein